MCAGKGAAQEQREVWRGDKSERTASPQWQLKSAVIVSKARLIVLLTKQVVLKSRSPLMASRWEGAQKLTAESVDLLLKIRLIPSPLTLLEYSQTFQHLADPVRHVHSTLAG